jgi:hypothetical protein
MAGCTRGVCTAMASPCCCGTALCRLAMGRRFPSTVGGSTKSIACPALRTMLTSSPTPCFLMGARGPLGSLEMTWMMQWRRLLTWSSPPCARRTYLTLRAYLSHCTRSRATLIQSGRHAWMRCATSFGTTILVVGRTSCDMLNTCFSCSTTPSASLQANGVILVVTQGRSSPLRRRSDVWARSMVPCASN